MWESLTLLKEQLTLIVALITALLALWRWLGKPVRDMLDRLKRLDEDMTDLLWDRLQQAHDDAVRRGWCSPGEKRRLTEIHRRYTAKGRNHLAATYEADILRLRDIPDTDHS